MRRLLAGTLVGLLVLGLGWTAAPGAAAAATAANPKVVLVVGATHGTTPTYRSWMNVVATTAAKYTKNLVKVYSPNATWSKVKSAMQGASIVVYMGHGNGFPSPYSTTLNPYTQNGMGLNATAGNGDSNTKYYGEATIASEVDLAPNAVVILSHLCYASGNSEPGKTEPSLSVAKARMDNFAAGFLKAGARAVIADGHGDPSWYIAQLFTQHKTVQQIWEQSPNGDGHIFSFASSRSAGYTVWSDPDQRSGSTYKGFYRSLVTKKTLTSDMVTGALYAPTDATPGYFVVPGAAEVVASEGAGLYADAALTPDPATGLAPATLPAATRLRVVSAAGTAADGTAIYEVRTLDDTSTGFALATQLAPRDSTPPRIWELDYGSGALSPDGDGSGDTLRITARASEWVRWGVRVEDAEGKIVKASPLEGTELASTWTGLLDGEPVPDGTYRATIFATDPWANKAEPATFDVVVDTVDPTLDGMQVQGLAPAATFSPNGDGSGDTVRLAYTASEPGTVLATVRGADGKVIDSFSAAMAVGAGSATWDGRTSSGAYAPDGVYSISIAPRDAAGNTGGSLSTEVAVYAALASVATSAKAIYAADADRLARTTRFSFTLKSPARVTWEILAPNGSVMVTRYADAELAAGTYAWIWGGRLPSKAWAPSGTYTSRVTATDGTLSSTQSAKVAVTAFRATLSDPTPSRGQKVTLSIVTTEPLKANPSVSVAQPGRSAVTYRTTRASSTVYRVTFTLSKSGTPGTLVIRITGTDTAGGRNSARATWSIE